MRSVQALRLLRIELTVAALTPSERFFVEGLGFTAGSRGDADPATAALYGATRIHQLALQRGGQVLLLQAFHPAGLPLAGGLACDQAFQHFAMPVPDMRLALARLLPFTPAAISRDGPQALPQRSGGAVCYKFRDPDGHPLELIEFPDEHEGGIDHSAIAVTEAERAIAFYRDRLGLRLAARQRNTGPEQDALDGLAGVQVEVVALEPAAPTPHLELLAYLTPPGRPAPPLRPRDIGATRLVFEVAGLDAPALLHDPDGHALVLIPSEQPIGV